MLTSVVVGVELFLSTMMLPGQSGLRLPQVQAASLSLGLRRVTDSMHPQEMASSLIPSNLRLLIQETTLSKCDMIWSTTLNLCTIKTCVCVSLVHSSLCAVTTRD